MSIAGRRGIKLKVKVEVKVKKDNYLILTSTLAFIVAPLREEEIPIR